VIVELRSPELGNLVQDRDPESAAPVEDPVSVSSVKLATGNFWTRPLKKPISNWRDHYIRSSRMSPQNDDSVYSVQDLDRPVYAEEESNSGPMLFALEPVAYRQQNSAQKNHFLRAKKKSAASTSKPKSNNIQSHYLRSSRYLQKL